MIISHKHKFIFIKTEKTAGTSIEIALSKFCGPDDIITPIVAADEAKRATLNYPGPQNYHIPFHKYTAKDLAWSIYRKRRLSFFNHAAATFVRRYIDPQIWDSYFKFCFERNPWDKAVSWYYWACSHEPGLSISEFIRSGKANHVKGFDLYTDSSNLLVDKVYKFECLQEAMEELRDRLGLAETPTLPHTKGNFRKKGARYRDLLSEEDRKAIGEMFSKEIALFDYKW